jgi:hypothetical protein
VLQLPAIFIFENNGMAKERAMTTPSVVVISLARRGLRFTGSDG